MSSGVGDRLSVGSRAVVVEWGGRQTVRGKPKADGVAFQIGEALELLTNGRLAATPHFVSGSPAASGGSSGEVSRETFAFFLQ
jgi:isopenicillin N synthase-like dioxygenase